MANIIYAREGFQRFEIDETISITAGNSSGNTSGSIPDGAKVIFSQQKVTEFGDTGTVATMDIGYTGGSTDELWDNTACTAITDKDSRFQEQFNVTTEKIKSGSDTITVTLNAAVTTGPVSVRFLLVYEQLIDLS